MTENKVVDLKLSAHLLRVMLDEKIPFEKKKGKMDYLVRIGADVNAKMYGKSMALWVKELGDEDIIKYVEENGGVGLHMSEEKRKELGEQFWDKNGKIKSIKEIKELVLMGADLSVENKEGYQVWRNLSFNEMNDVLKDLPKGYVIDGNVRLYDKELTELPDFSKIKVVGDFWCYKNQLTTLLGAPISVSGGFSCRENKLTTLEGAPREVGEDFYCSCNLLTTLEGAPREVGRDFYCRDNQLTSLDGKPEKIGGEFVIEEEVLKKIRRNGIKNIWKKCLVEVMGCKMREE